MMFLKFRTWYGGEMHFWGFKRDLNYDSSGGFGDTLFIPPIDLLAPQMRGTQIEDINKSEIFEDDIVWTDHNFGAGFGRSIHIGQVIYSRGSFSLRNGPIQIPLESLSRNHWKLEVKGNWHQNPELLDVEG